MKPSPGSVRAHKTTMQRKPYEDRSQGKLAGNDRIEVEVILVKRTDSDLLVKTDEDSIPVQISRSKARVIRTKNGVTTISISEHQAIKHNLI